MDGRELALDILMEILEKDGYSHVVLNQALSKYQYLEKSERAFISRVTEGTLEYLIQIDYIINLYSKVKVKKMKPLIRTLLRMSVYQIFYMDRIPDSAVCNEAVKLAVKRKFQGLKGFVNGVLRSIAREKEQIRFPADAIRYSVPEWMIEMWQKSYDVETVRVMLEAFLKDSKLTVRCNLDQASLEEIRKSLENQGVTVTETEYAEDMMYLEQFDYLESLEAFQKGWIQVQDVSSGFVGRAADPAPGDVILDVCGAPGGKSLHLADLLKGTGHVEVRDLTEYKVRLIQDNIDRSGFRNIEARVWDALELDEESVGKADIVIADLPCSGLGIIGKKPDIKHKMTPEKLAELAALQREILSVVHQYVKPGGKLIYSTCTIDRQENEENASWFLEHFPFEPMNIEGKLGEKLKEGSMKNGQIQLLPGIHPCDGFFIAAFQKKQ
ncbi:MAG: 16S rRNA (cytosine(967)-C(5))-methyltransferase RsmB [Hungatella sp.]